jgi:O-antigen ligase
LCFLWPAELPIAIFWHGFAFPLLDNGYIVLVHASMMVIVAGAFLALPGRRIPAGSGDWRWFSVTGLVYTGVGVMPLLISSATGVEARFAFQDLVFGYLCPLLFVLAALTLPAREQQRLWIAFYAGWVVFLCMSIVLLVSGWRTAVGINPVFESAPFAQRLIMWRFTLGDPWNLYGLVMGNSNKLSNNLVMFLLMSVTLLNIDGSGKKRKALLLTFWLLGVFTLIVMFSRAAMLLLPLVVAASGVLPEIPRTPRRVGLALVLMGFVVLAIAVPEIFDYLLAAKRLPDADADPLGTYSYRLDQWAVLLSFFSDHPGAALFGLGATGYGLHFFGEPGLGTHNTFLDLWAEAGIFSPLLLCVTVLGIGIQAFAGGKSNRRRIVIVAGIVSMVLLMTREHSFSYLYVTSLGGLCLITLLYCTVAPDRERLQRQSISRPQTAVK